MIKKVVLFTILFTTSLVISGCGPSTEQLATMTATQWTPTSSQIPATSTPTQTNTPIPTSTSLPTITPTQLPVCTPGAVIDEKWLQVAKSDDIVVYYNYLKENPDTEHVVELSYLVDRMLRIKIDQAAVEGKQIVQNANLVPGSSGTGVFGLGTTFWVGGGYFPQFNEGIDLYSDPTSVLAIKMVKDGIEYVEGRGLIIMKDKVYVMGLPSIPLQLTCQN